MGSTLVSLSLSLSLSFERNEGYLADEELPWVNRKHFIPLSSSYSELYNLQTFFTGLPPTLTEQRGNETIPVTTLNRPSPVPALPDNEDGSEFNADTVLKEIAESGSEWKKEHLRKEDMEVSLLLVRRGPSRLN